ncbi:MAG: recombination protein RecR [Clostridia bacterium]|nr:recombination protein RecR [Clostridia bacterium]MBO5315484.1 recombination protein RecR [Clostridia bacterium]MBR3806536.1 recombination protein RecR [Clostridia bacterium]
MAEYIAPLQRLIEEFRRLPGVGAKTAARYAFATLNLSDEEAARFADAINGVKRDVFKCPVCFGLSASAEGCEICKNPSRDPSVICVVESPKDVMVMERVRGYRGLYHVLGGSLSPLDNITPDDLTVKELVSRIETGEVGEIIIATNPTPSGDTTAAYLARILEPYGVTVSRLAYGIPVGGDIEYADEVTLYRAMEGRRSYN